jgi:hypothetical protein
LTGATASRERGDAVRPFLLAPALGAPLEPLAPMRENPSARRAAVDPRDPA